MGKIKGFLDIDRQIPADRPIAARLKDWNDVHVRMPSHVVQDQAARCMDCGIPFCHKGCPLGNIIPEWNDLVYNNRWKEALTSLLSTNNFPEFTGRVCPAPCEDSCVLSINDKPVTIERIEQGIMEHAYDAGWINPNPPKRRTGKKVAIIGSGPSGLACADQLNKAGHWVTVFERHDRVGGLLTYGIPDFKLEKWVVQRRIDLMRNEGVLFKTHAHVGVNVPVQDLSQHFDAIVLAGGATKPRDILIPGRELNGVHFAMDYLRRQNKDNQGSTLLGDPVISAAGKNVVILGGGDTGSDCHGTARRQGAKQVYSLELLAKPPVMRHSNNPWPEWSQVFRTSSSHDEGGKRDWGVLTKRFSGEADQVKTIHLVRLDWQPSQNGAKEKMVEIPNSEFELNADLVLLALGFLGPETNTVIRELGVELTERGHVAIDENYRTNLENVFACGDMRRGQSLVVWAIWEGREAARCVDGFLEY